MGAIASQITSLTIVYSTVYSGADQSKYQSSASLAFVPGEFPAQMASNTENDSIWWRHHDKSKSQSGPKYRTFISSLIASNDMVIGQCSFVYIMVWWRMSSLLTRIDFNVNPGTDK